jgi:uncharacterized protein YecE (DUF72 family)
MPSSNKYLKFVASPITTVGGSLEHLPDTPLLIGTAGWTVPREEAAEFPGEGTHLQRYAARLTAAEINSSFYRPHRASTYERWASSVPDGFRFSVKMPKEITHSARLKEAEGLLDSFLPGVQGLGKTLGCLLIQLPPSLTHESSIAGSFFTALRHRYLGDLVCEPRHDSWLQPGAEAMLTEFRIGRVAADPDRPAGAGEPGGWSGIRYYRLHGSPRMYYSCYSRTELVRMAEQLTRARAEGSTVWCIFDNTALGAATRNARELMQLLSEQGEP